MLAHLERPAGTAPGLRRILDDFGLTYFANGLIGFIFSATGPVAIILSVGTRGGLSEAELASWVFGVFFINGLITLAMSWRYQTPRVRQLRSQVLVFARADFQKCHYNSASCSGAAGFSIPNA